MTPRLRKPLPLCAALAGAWLGLADGASAQHHYLGRPQPDCYPPPQCLPGMPAAPKLDQMPKGDEKKDETPQQTRPETQMPTAPSEQAGAAGGESFAAATGLMMGDQLGIPALGFRSSPPVSPSSRSEGAAVLPTARGFKVAENESPRPLDRLYYGFNYFEDVNKAVNQRIGAPVTNANAYRNTFGFEKTFLDCAASVGFRIPINTLDSSSTVAGFGGTDTAAGDLTMITKYAFWQDQVSGSLLSGGLAITFPTGPTTFADANIAGSHSTVLQPYVGYIFNRERFYLHGFSAFAFATQSDDVTFYTFDVGAGYRLYQAACPGAFLTTVIPTIEMHVNIPLNHRGALDVGDPIGAADTVNLTSGVVFGLGRRSTLATALVVPVTGPRPFDYEFLMQFNWRFGPTAAAGAGTGNILGN